MGAAEAPRGRRLDIAGQRYCLGVGRDITDRKRAEREITRAKERLDLALRGSNLAIWDWDLAANQVYFSDDWNVLFDEVLYRTFPLESDPDMALPVACVTLDNHDGNVTWKAREFARRARRAGWRGRARPRDRAGRPAAR